METFVPPVSRQRTATLRATNLTSVMQQQGRSLAWLGKQCGVSSVHVGRICSGKRRVTPEMARRSSDLLGVPVHLLFAESTDTDAT
jgi:antitoxin component HigA of HigAB toxin-antitoxin module